LRLEEGGVELLIANGRVVTETGAFEGDILVRDGRIAAVGGDLASRAGRAPVLDAAGLSVLPGFVDLHVHADDEIGRWTLADDFGSASAAALLGGVTTIVAFATQRPGEQLQACVGRYLAKVAGRSRCDVAFHLTPTGERWDWAALARLAGRGFGTVKLYTTYRQAGLYSSWERLAELMPRLAELGLRLLLHCEDDDTLARVDASRLDLCDPFSHTRLRPPGAETEAIERALELARQAGCPLHVVHVSTARGAGLVAAARPLQRVSAETCPQYLFLDEEALRGPDGHRLLCSPPLRDESTRRQLVELVLAGALDVLATDHCPFFRRDKDAVDGDLRAVPCGLPGVGALVPLAFELLAGRGEAGLRVLVTMVSAKPARLAGLHPRKGTLDVGADADLVVLDLEGEQRAVRSTLADAHDPWAGYTTRLAFRHVLVRGVEVVRDGRLVDAPPSGTTLQG